MMGREGSQGEDAGEKPKEGRNPYRRRGKTPEAKQAQPAGNLLIRGSHGLHVGSGGLFVF